MARPSLCKHSSRFVRRRPWATIGSLSPTCTYVLYLHGLYSSTHKKKTAISFFFLSLQQIYLLNHHRQIFVQSPRMSSPCCVNRNPVTKMDEKYLLFKKKKREEESQVFFRCCDQRGDRRLRVTLFDESTSSTRFSEVAILTTNELSLRRIITLQSAASKSLRSYWTTKWLRRSDGQTCGCVQATRNKNSFCYSFLFHNNSNNTTNWNFLP